MKNRTVKILKRLLNGKVLLSMAALGMLVSCNAYMGGYSETDGAYYNPNSDQIPQYDGNYAYGNQVGGYYDFDDNGSDYNDNSNSLIRQNQYNNQQQADKYQNWGGQDDSDFGAYTGTDTYYTDFGSPFWGFGGWGYPWGYGFNSYMGFPYGYGYGSYWGYPYGSWGLGLGFGWGSSWFGGYPYYGYGYPYYGGGYPYYGGGYGHYRERHYQPRTKSMLSNGTNGAGFQSRRNSNIISNGVRNSVVSRGDTGFRRLNNNGEFRSDGNGLRNEGFRQMRSQQNGQFRRYQQNGQFQSRAGENGIIRRQGNFSRERSQMGQERPVRSFQQRAPMERSFDNNRFNSERSFSPSRSFEGGGFRSESFGGGRSGGFSGGGFHRGGR